MLKVTGAPAFTGWSGQSIGQVLHCEWADIGNPDPNLSAGEARCFTQGPEKVPTKR